MRLIIIILLIFILNGCNIKLSNNDWFQKQGLNLTECGPTLTANILRWKNINVTNHLIRDYYKTPAWWSFKEITSILDKYNIKYTYKPSTLITLSDLASSYMAIVYVSNSHFIIAKNDTNDNFIIYDSLNGIYYLTTEDLYDQISLDIYGNKYKFIAIQ